MKENTKSSVDDSTMPNTIENKQDSDSANLSLTNELVIGHSNTFHDSSISIDMSGHLFAEGIERHSQNKRAWRAEHNAMLSVPSIQRWIKNTNQETSLTEKMTFISTWTNKSDVIFTDQFISELGLRKGYQSPIIDIVDEGRVKINSTQVKSQRLDHHLAHASFAALSSPFSECLTLVIDGYGEDESHTCWYYDNNKFERIDGSDPDASLGALYALITEFCGFRWSQGHEWKVMGLAAYGEQDSKVYEFFRELIEVDGIKLISKKPLGITWSSSLQDVCFDKILTEKLRSLVGGFRQRNDPDVERSAVLARSFQDAYQDIVMELVQATSRLNLSNNLAFGGGCALNSATNGHLLRAGKFNHLHIPSAPGDDGNALGAVLHHRHITQAYPRIPQVLTPYLGSEISSDIVAKTLSYGKLPFVKIDDELELWELIATELASGKIVAWVQGRAEFGPRALGNRSILADPRNPESKNRINKAVKFREKYRPLAPSILHEHGPDYFEDYQESPYMERTLRFREDVKHLVPAVVHADGTGRLQSVSNEVNPSFHGLITQFHSHTGIPLLVNTSLNVMGKPIIHSVQDALSVFVTTSLDLLVIGNYIVGYR